VGGFVLGRAFVKGAASEGALSTALPFSPNCDTVDDIRIVVSGPPGVRRMMRWFKSKGYPYWMGRRKETGELEDNADFVVGAMDSSSLTKVSHSPCNIALHAWI
jgi:hypothetical protein